MKLLTAASKVLGVIIIARNGDRSSFYQDPKTYAGSDTETTALGVADSHQLGSLLRSTYLTKGSSSYIEGMQSDLVDNNEFKARVKAGVEGTVVFDSAIALLQGLYPPNPNNKIVLANETTVVAPLGGYQYVPVETVEPGNDRSLESWTDCPTFQKHIQSFYSSEAFKAREKGAQSFFTAAKDYVFGRPLTLENAYNIYDFMHTELVHNKTCAHRLPPTLIEQARGLADFHESGVFGSADINSIANVAGRTLMHSLITALERIAFNGDPLQFLLIETTYQPFISFFQMTGAASERPELKAMPNYASAMAIELRRGGLPDTRDFLRIKFKNGTSDRFEDVHVFGHHADIPLTEFIYRAEGAAIDTNRKWKSACSASSLVPFTTSSTVGAHTQVAFSGAFALVGLLSLYMATKLVKRSRANAREARLRLPGDENAIAVPTAEKTRLI